MTGVHFSRRAAAVWTVLVCVTCPVVSVADHQSIPVEPLAAFAKIDPTDITVSGISSGAFSAHQFHIAFSSLVKGAGIVAGGPFGCAAQVDNITPPFGNPFVLTLVPRRVVASLAVCTHFGRSDFRSPAWPWVKAAFARSSRVQRAFASHLDRDTCLRNSPTNPSSPSGCP